MVLKTVGTSPSPLSLTEIANSCAINKTATQRFLNTLTSLGYVQRIDKKYTIGSRTITLCASSLNNFGLKNMAAVYLDEFSVKYNVTVNLEILEDDKLIILYRREIDRFLKYDLTVGSKLPINCSSGGKILLAYLPEGELHILLASLELPKLTPHSITSKETLINEIQTAHNRGYGSTKEELALGHTAFAAAIFNSRNQAVAAIGFSMQAIEAPREQMLTDLLGIAESLSRNLGYTENYPRV